MMIDQLDAANLVALHALLEERHVTRAAKRLGITQSSMSHRLARLRATLKDPLFLRSPLGLLPTPRAEAVAVPLRDALRALEAVVAPPRDFEPATSRYTLSIAMPDLLAPLVPRLIVGLTAEAPLLRVRLSPIAPSLSASLAAGDPVLALAPSQLVDGPVITRSLGEVCFGVVGRRGHPAFRRPLTTASWLQYAHVIQRLGNDRTNTLEDELQRRGLRRRVGVEAASFLAGLFVLSSSDMLMNAPVPLVNEAAAQLDLTTRDAPIRLPRVRICLCWHERFHGDPAHRWARDRVFETVRNALA